jgi:hypothetical protein
MPRKWPVFQTAVETGGSRHLVCPDTKRVSDSLFTTELQLDAAAAVRASNLFALLDFIGRTLTVDSGRHEKEEGVRLPMDWYPLDLRR